ncbi:hypothetical protein I6F14_10520 [Bradyrhizobium sp. IC3069]|nr:hypothetical protein [Bradyrhizobium sp. IC4059]MCA1518420.1 hypothetical protein [Bradyrhizobium sp. IC3069]
MIELTEHKSLSHETLRRGLAENGLKPWRRDMYCTPHIDGEYVARMEDCPISMPRRPIQSGRSCASTQSPVQLISEARQPNPAAPGLLERYDYEYCSSGTVNLFVFLDVHRPSH